MTQRSRIINFAREQSLASPDQGNGGDVHIVIGRDSGGTVYRDLLLPAFDWSGPFYRLISATLRLRASGSTHVGGSGTGTTRVNRVSDPWVSTDAGEGHWASSLPTVYPGPNVEATGQATLNHSTVAGTLVAIDITTIVGAWLPDTILKPDGVTFGDAATNHGIRVRADDESTTVDAASFYGMRYGTSAYRPYIEIVYEDDTPPNAPIVTAPEEGDPAVIASTGANALTVSFLFSDPDAADSCQLVELEVYGDGATDGAPGTRIATSGPVAPTPLGSLNAHSVTATGLTARTNQRYRLRTYDGQQWGPWTSLADGRVFPAYTIGAPVASAMQSTPDSPIVAGSLNSPDGNDYITGWEGEFYRDTPAGSVSLWAPGMTDIGGTSTRSEVPYAGAQLLDGDVVRWRHRHRNRDAVIGAWSSWMTQRITVLVGPDAMSPTSVTTKLQTRTPTLTIAHSSPFTGYEWRLYRSGVLIHGEGGGVFAPATSKQVVVPEGKLNWGDGGDLAPVEWEAAIELEGTSGIGPFSPRYPIRINALPATVLSMPERSAQGHVPTANPRIDSLFDDPDRSAYAEYAMAHELELRVAATPQGTGSLLEVRQDIQDREQARVGKLLDLLQTTTGWVPQANVAVATYSATNPSGYSGNSLEVQATGGSSSNRSADKALSLDLGEFGTGSIIRLHRRFTSATNLTAWRIYFATATAYEGFDIALPADSLNTWTEVAILKGAPVAVSGTLDWGAITGIFFHVAVSGAYTGNLQVRDLRIGTVRNAADTPAGHLAPDGSYDVRARYRDDAATKVSSTLAAAMSAGASNVKYTDGTWTVGDELTVGAGVQAQTRKITNVGTSGSGGTGLTVEHAFTRAAGNGALIEARYWGPWTSWLRFTYTAPPVVAANTPADGASVTDPTRTLTWTFTSTRAQASFTARLYQRVSGVDQLIWTETQESADLSWTIPPFLLETGNTYAWEIVGYDTAGLSGTTTRRTFTTSFTPPAVLTGLTATGDAGASIIALAWTASGDPNLDHYQVEWRRLDGTWARVDPGPVSSSDLGTPLTAVVFNHAGARLGDNEYRMRAHNGAQGGEWATVSGTLESPSGGSWVLVVPGMLVQAMRVTRARRRQAPVMEEFVPPGRGSTLHLSWGRDTAEIATSILLRPSDHGDLSTLLAGLAVNGTPMWLKAPAGWSWDPLWCIIPDMPDETQVGGLLIVSPTFRQTEED